MAASLIRSTDNPTGYQAKRQGTSKMSVCSKIIPQRFHTRIFWAIIISNPLNEIWWNVEFDQFYIIKWFIPWLDYHHDFKIPWNLCFDLTQHQKKAYIPLVWKLQCLLFLSLAPMVTLLSESEVSAYLYWFVDSEEVKTLMKSLSIAMQHTINAIARDQPIIFRLYNISLNHVYWMRHWCVRQVDPYQVFFTINFQTVISNLTNFYML